MNEVNGEDRKTAGGTNQHPAYVVITPACDAARHIEHVLNSMIHQNARPLRWLVVNDGSTDDTGNILRIWRKRCDFLEVLDIPPGGPRNFVAMVQAATRGYEHLKHLDFQFVGNLDADMTLEPDYFERLLLEFERDPKLGIASGVYLDEQRDGSLVLDSTPSDFCPGGLQCLRRECYDEIGGYPPLREGGCDTAAVMMAKMKGWKVRSYPELKAIHHGRREVNFWQLMATRFSGGRRDYAVGTHPAYAMAKSLKRIGEKPAVLGAMARLAGYLRSWMARSEREISPELVAFVRREQLRKLRAGFRQKDLRS